MGAIASSTTVATGTPSAMPSSGDDVGTKPAVDSAVAPTEDAAASSNSSLTDTVTDTDPIFLAAGCGGGLLILCGLAYICCRSSSSKPAEAAPVANSADVDAENPPRRSSDTARTPEMTSMNIKDTSMTEYTFCGGEGTTPNDLTLGDNHQTLRNAIAELKQENEELED